MKNIIIFITLFLLITIKNYAIENYELYYSMNFSSNTTKLLSNSNFSSNYILGFDYDYKRIFTHVPNGTSKSRKYFSISKFGLSINNFIDETEYRLVGELINFDVYSNTYIPMIGKSYASEFYDAEEYDNSIVFGGLKILKISNDIFRKNDIEWIKIKFARGLHLLNSRLNNIIPSIYVTGGYSSFKPDGRNATQLKEFKNMKFSGIDLELGANLDIEYENISFNCSSSYRRIFEFNPDIEIIRNYLKFGYVYYFEFEFNGIDSFNTEKYKAMSIYITGNYDIFKVNSNIQSNQSFGIEISINPFLVLWAIEKSSDTENE